MLEDFCLDLIDLLGKNTITIRRIFAWAWLMIHQAISSKGSSHISEAFAAAQGNDSNLRSQSPCRDWDDFQETGPPFIGIRGNRSLISDSHAVFAAYVPCMVAALLRSVNSCPHFFFKQNFAFQAAISRRRGRRESWRVQGACKKMPKGRRGGGSKGKLTFMESSHCTV